MQMIEPADKVILQLLGKPKRNSEANIRYLKYTAKLSTGEGIILHNFLTGESLFFKDDEDIKRDIEYLFEHYFFVNNDFNDLKTVEELRKAFLLINQKKEITSFKILTTTDCNARCAYCYELGMDRVKMSPETAGEVIRYIKHNCGNKQVTLSWFGGEPLLNSDVIDDICNGLARYGIEYSSVMTSNGYLFTPELTKKAVKLWNLKNIQITLDGTKDNYNRIKAYIHSSDDPYKRVINNIKLLTEKGIRVNIRLNVSLDNYRDMHKLVQELSLYYPSKENISVYASGLFQETAKNSDPEGKKRLYDHLRGLTKELYRLGLAKRSRRSLKLRTSGCMADNDSHRGISPSGMLMKCEHHIFTKLTGNIKEKSEDVQLLDEWKEKLDYEEICNDCVVLPVCYRLKNCPVSHICTQEEKEQYIEDLFSALRAYLKENIN